VRCSPDATPPEVVSNLDGSHRAPNHIEPTDHGHGQRDGLALAIGWEIRKLRAIYYVPAAIAAAMEHDVSGRPRWASDQEARLAHLASIDELMATLPVSLDHGVPQPIPGTHGTQGSRGPARPTSRTHSPSTS